MTIVSGEYLSGSPFPPTVASIRIPALPQFVARDHFKRGTHDAADVQITGLWSDFDKFLDKIEGPVLETVITGKLYTHSVGVEKLFGGLSVQAKKMSLSQLWFLLKRQGHGEKGDLVVNGRLNIFCCELNEGELFEVFAQWRFDLNGWVMGGHKLNQSGLLLPTFWAFFPEA